MKKEKKNGETPAAKKGGESKEHKKNWKEYTAMVNDIEQFLSDHVVLRRNVIAGRVECRIPKCDVFADWIADGLPTDQWLSVSDYIVNTLWRALSRQKKVKADDIRRIIDSDFSPSYNPFTYYLEHLPPWNGVDDYILKLSAVSLGRAFVEMGFQRKTIRNVRGYVVVRRSDEERRSLRQAMAAGPDDTDTDVTDVL